MRQSSRKMLWALAPTLAVVTLAWASDGGRTWFAPQPAQAAGPMTGMNGSEFVRDAFGTAPAAVAPAAEPAVPAAPTAAAATPVAKLQRTAAATARVVPTTGGVQSSGDHFTDKWHPIHFKPMIDTASNEQCLACHKEILEAKPLAKSPAGVKAADSIAWYQTLDTYKGPQSDFHVRHLSSDFAKSTMDLKCTFCHQGNDPREEVPNSHLENQGDTSHSMRKMVDPADTCLRCHGKFPVELMTGLEGSWATARENIEDASNPDTRNGCLTCHKDMYRTVRHQVTYLKPENIEKLAADGSSDVCYGCHGGRQWYRINFSYPRHAWPTMADNVPETPDWAKDRKTESDERYRRAN